MSDQRLEQREKQACREVGRTEIKRALSAVLVVFFVVTLVVGVLSERHGTGERFGLFFTQARAYGVVPFRTPWECGTIQERQRIQP